MEFVKYYLYRWHRMIEILISVLVINYLGAWVYDAIYQQYASMVFAVSVTIVVSIAVLMSFCVLGGRYINRCFPVAPQKPKAKKKALRLSSDKSAVHAERACQCKRAEGMMRLGFVDNLVVSGEDAQVMLSTCCTDSERSLHVELRIGQKKYKVTMHIGYCPICGGRLLLKEE